MALAEQGGTMIRTPDQRLRVFVSSTIAELADERKAVARAVAGMGLTPVLFELGARPHPPRSLYRAYIEQSDVFVGVYWQRYGWVGPGMDISGLEDEYELSASMPRLLYVKAPAPEREPGLAALLDRIRAEAAASYRTFRSSRELARLVRDDLAVLLSERFGDGPEAGMRVGAGTAGAATASAAGRRHTRPLPVAATSLVGRDGDIATLSQLLEGPDVRLVTLTGPGGIGKTRLAVAVADRVAGRFSGGVVFAPLASIGERELVLPAVAAAAGASVEGRQSAVDALAEHFTGAPTLLVLDNLEQVIDVAPDIAELLESCPHVTVLATSRTALRVRAEHEYPVPPLAVPPAGAGPTVEELASQEAVELFVDRARATRHDFVLDATSAPAVAEICRRLDGLPLAIELAAARVRLLPPPALLDLLANRLDALGPGPRDLPERQRTLRATVEWSVGLLTEEEARMLTTLAAFHDGWTLEAAAHVAGLDDVRTLDLLDALVRHSLVLVVPGDDGVRFRMLETVLEYAAEQLAASADVADIERRHASYYRQLASRADPHLRGFGQGMWADRLQAEAGNLRAAIRWFLAEEPTSLPHVFRTLWLFWWLKDHIVEARGWIAEVLRHFDELDGRARAELVWTSAATALEAGDDTAALAAVGRLPALLDSVDDPYLEAISDMATAWILPMAGDLDGAVAAATRAVERLRGLEEPFMTAMAVSTLSTMEIAAGRIAEARGHLDEVHDLGARLENDWLLFNAEAQLGAIAVIDGRLDDARLLLEQGAARSLAAENSEGLALCLLGVARLALAEGAPRRAALALGAADGLRRRAGLSVWPAVRRLEAELVAVAEAALDAAEFAGAIAAGSELGRRDAAAIAAGDGA